MTPTVRCALANSQAGEWHPDWAKRVLLREGEDPALLLAQCDARLDPVNGRWLADRLKALWHSTTPSGSMTAETWLRETGRLLKHYPLDILHHAIDQAALKSERGFTPTAGAVTAIAEPMLKERQTQRARLARIVHGEPQQDRKPWEQSFRAPDQVCTPAEAAEIIALAGIGRAESDPSAPTDMGREYGTRQPTREDYLRLGVPAATLDSLGIGA